MTRKLLLLSASVVTLLALTSTAKADPMKLRPIAITASNTYAGTSPSNVNDGNSGTIWNAGGYATQWIQLDLGKPTSVKKIRMQVAQSPAGNTIHTISVGADPTHMTNVYVFNGYTSDGQWLEGSGDVGTYRGGNVRYIRITTTSSPSWIAWKEIEVYGGVEYSGYWGDAFYWVGGGDYIPETTAAGSNLVWIATQSSNLAGLTSKLAEAQQHGAKAIVNVQTNVFNGASLTSDWQTQWSNIVSTINNSGYASTVAGFYLCDEPYLNGVTKATLNTLATQMRADFPTKALAVILSVPELQNTVTDSSYVSMFDWVGFDCYDSWTSAYGTPGGMPTLINKLRSLLSATQRMIAVPWSYVTSDTSTTEQAFIINNNLNNWQQEIASDSKYIAIASFLWTDIGGGSGFYGARDMSWLKARLYELGHSFVNLPPTDTHVFALSTLAGSSYIPDYAPFAAFDNVTGDMWNSGCYSYGCYAVQGPTPPWVQGVLNGLTHLSRIDLTVEQDITGTTTHNLYGFTPSTGSWTLLRTFTGVTQNSQILTWTGSVDVTAIYVATTQSPTWVAWQEIQMYQ